VSGTWRQPLPPTPSGGAAHTITVTNGSTTVVLQDVVFGEVFICGGQSNMAFSMAGMTNSSTEAARADHYSGTAGIRLFTVGQATKASPGAQYPFLHTIVQGWSPASTNTVMQGGEFGYFSAVCWEMGVTIHEGLGEPSCS